MDKIKEALLEYQKFNPIRNDLDAYLYHMGEWALGESAIKPTPVDYGIQNGAKIILTPINPD